METGSDYGRIIVGKISSDVQSTKKIRARIVSDRDKPVMLKKMRIIREEAKRNKFDLEEV